MNVLLTGSSGWLVRTLASRLTQQGYKVMGLDPKPGAFTKQVGPISDASLVQKLLLDHRIDSVIHSGVLPPAQYSNTPLKSNNSATSRTPIMNANPCDLPTDSLLGFHSLYSKLLLNAARKWLIYQTDEPSNE
jgi:hypothetical protein